jgi:hypothetical protein
MANTTIMYYILFYTTTIYFIKGETPTEEDDLYVNEEDLYEEVGNSSRGILYSF